MFHTSPLVHLHFLILLLPHVQLVIVAACSSSGENTVCAANICDFVVVVAQKRGAAQQQSAIGLAQRRRHAPLTGMSQTPWGRRRKILSIPLRP
jgi:hypothetical protein